MDNLNLYRFANCKEKDKWESMTVDHVMDNLCDSINCANVRCKDNCAATHELQIDPRTIKEQGKTEGMELSQRFWTGRYGNDNRRQKGNRVERRQDRRYGSINQSWTAYHEGTEK